MATSAVTSPTHAGGNEMLATLVAASRAMAGTLEQEQVVATLARFARQLTGATGCTVFQWDGTGDFASVLVDDISGIGSSTDRAGATMHTQEQAPFAPFSQIFDSEPALVVTLQRETGQYWPDWLNGNERTVAFAALTIHDEPFGFLEVNHSGSRAGEFSLELLQTLAVLLNQASMALENARMFLDTYQRERFFNALGRVGLAASATLDVETVLNLICEESLTVFEVDAVYIWQRDDDQLVGIAAQGQGREAFIGTRVSVSDEENFSVSITRRGEARFLNRLNEKRIGIGFKLPDRESIRSVLGIPLKREEVTIGALVLVDKSLEDRISQRDVSNALQFGSQAAIAIQNAQMVQELRILNERLDERVASRTMDLEMERDRVQFLLRITSELAASLDEDRVLNRALELVNEIVNATEGLIMLVNPETDEFHFRAMLGRHMLLPPGGVPSGLRSSEGLAGWLLQSRETIVVNDLDQDERWLDRGNRHSQQRSALGVPLVSGDEAIGVLMFFHKQPNAFTSEQLELVEAVAYQVANAIGNAQLYMLIREQAEQLGGLLREEQIQAAKNQAMLESIADGVLVAGPDGRIILANLAVSRMLAIPREALLGKRVDEMLGIYGISGKPWMATIAEWERSSYQAGQLAHLTDDLQIENLIINVRLSPVFANGSFEGTISIFRDITKEVEVDRVKSEFVSNVSHELRTPMTSIKGYSDLMLMGAVGTMTESQRQYLTVIKNNADRLKLLVDDLLDISRIETGKTILQAGPMDLGQLIQDIVDGHLHGRIQHENKPMQHSLDIPAGLPLVKADQEKVTRILTNLIDNAFNYTPANGAIAVRARVKNGFMVVSVSDNGIGIPIEIQPKIFDRFYRSESDDVRQVPGTGLGLSIVNSLVEMHGGELTVSSTPEKGSTFTFTLPMASLHETELT